MRNGRINRLDDFDAQGLNALWLWLQAQLPQTAAFRKLAQIVGHIDSTENVGLPWGVQSVEATGTDEAFGDLLTADGLGGSTWSPATPGVSSPCVDFPDVVADLAASNTLLGYWRLGEAATTWADTSGNPGGADNAAETGSGTAVTWNVTPGALSGAQDDGAIEINEGKYALAPEAHSPRFNLNSGPMTVTAWVKPLATTRTFMANIAGVWGDAGFGNCGWTLIMQQSPGGHEITFWRRETGTPAQSGFAGSVVVPEDEWVFAAGTYDSSTGTHLLYINGIVQATHVNTNVVTLPTFNSGVAIGGGAGTLFVGGGVATLSAQIDEVSVWADALTSSEIMVLYAGGLPCSSTTGTIDSTENVGDTWGVHSEDPDTGPETAGKVLTSIGDGGSIWSSVTAAPPTGAAGGDLGGTYPNPDVAIVDNPVLGSGTPSSSTFLRGDRTWATVSTDPATDTKIWMPLSTTVAGDDVLVYDASHQLIPTLTPI